MAYTAAQREHAIGLLAASMREWDGDEKPNVSGVRQALAAEWGKAPGDPTLYRWWRAVSLEEMVELRRLHATAKEEARKSGALEWEAEWDQLARQKLADIWGDDWTAMSVLDQMKTAKLGMEVRSHPANQARGVDTGGDRLQRHRDALAKAGLE